jgi:xanthine dehydrogenase YagT iron-sulfur-binding subunit
MHDLTEFRGSPVLLVFHGRAWDPAAREYADAYNRLVAALPIPVVDAGGPLEADYGIGSAGGVVLLDANGDIRWKHVGHTPASAMELSRALTEIALPAPGGSWSRREFVATAAGAILALVATAPLTRAEAALAEPHSTKGTHHVRLDVNGRAIELDLDSRVSLLDALREYAGLTGTKKGCDHGQCGACTVHVDGRRTLSCLTFAVMEEGRKITTIEGLARGDDLHPMQQAFITHDGFQCGYCTCGQIMSATAMVDEPWGPTDDDVREAMSGNICRCGAYPGIVAAIQQVRGGRRATQ